MAVVLRTCRTYNGSHIMRLVFATCTAQLLDRVIHRCQEFLVSLRPAYAYIPSSDWCIGNVGQQ